MTEEIPSIPFLLGKLQGSVDSISQNQAAHQMRDDARHTETQGLIVDLTKHVNHENDLMNQRIAAIEKENADFDKDAAEDAAHRRGMWKVAALVTTAVGFGVTTFAISFANSIPGWFGFH